MTSSLTNPHRASLCQAFQHLEISSSSNLRLNVTCGICQRLTSGATPLRFYHHEPLSRMIAPEMRQRLSSATSLLQSYRAPPSPCVAMPTLFIIAMDDDAYDYNMPDQINPEDLYTKLFCHACEILNMMQMQPLSVGQETALEKYLEDALAELVFGSNAIEAAGAGYEVTMQLCRAVFYGQDVADEIDEQSPEYDAIKRDLMRKNRPSGHRFILQSRREIVQHAKAASFMINQVFLCDKDFTEDMILQAHRILTQNVDTEQGISWTDYSGVYRRDWVSAGLTTFIDPVQVPSAMRKWIQSLDTDLENAKKTGMIDPVAVATKYCHKFVNIHPFLDGNGRMCRLILNTMLLKYGGNVVAIGKHGDDRDEYLGIAADASMAESFLVDDDEDDSRYARKPYSSLATFALGHFAKSMRELASILKES